MSPKGLTAKDNSPPREKRERGKTLRFSRRKKKRKIQKRTPRRSCFLRKRGNYRGDLISPKKGGIH